MARQDFDAMKNNAIEKKSEEPGNFFEKIIAFFLGLNDPEREKKRQLKEIAKQLRKSRFKFYKPKGELALPSMGKFFHTIYRIVGPAQVLLKNATSSGALKTIIIESYMAEEQLLLNEQLREDRIKERSKNTGIKQLSSELNDELLALYSGFDLEIVKEINALYNQLLNFMDLVNYDYYFLLKKFDSAMPERDFVYVPRFETINGEYVAEDLKDFLEVIPYIVPNKHWEKIFDIISTYKNMEVVNRNDWKKLLTTFLNIKKSRVLELIVRHISKDPDYNPDLSGPTEEEIVETFLNEVKTRTENIITKIKKDQKTQKIDSLLNEIFGTTVVARMKYYTDKANLSFTSRMLGGYEFIPPMNFLKAFLLDYFKKDIREVVDLMLIKGKWSTNILSQQLSDSFNALMDISEKIIQFDESLAEEGSLGSKIKVVLMRVDRDKNSMTVLRQQLKQVNDFARELINTAAYNLIAVGKNLKTLIEDYSKTPREVIVNWKEVENSFEQNPKEAMSAVYKKIYYFVQLVQYFLKGGEMED